MLRAVSHALRSPTATIKAIVSGLLEDDVSWTPDQLSEALETIDEELIDSISSGSGPLSALKKRPGGEEVRLTPTEWSIVQYLVRNPGRVVTHRQLVTAVWGQGYDPDPNLLRVHMGHVRRKLEPNPATPAYFITDSGVGYRFDPGVVPHQLRK